jgi:hypothetical protein
MCVLAVLFSSCQRIKIVVDPAAATPGYKLFKAKTNGFRISFEYPDSWSRAAVDRVGTYFYMPLFPPDSSIIIDSSVRSRTNKNAGELFTSDLDSDSYLKEFQLLSRNKIRLGQIECEEAIYSYIYPGQDLHIPDVHVEPGELAIARLIDADYQGYIYDINFISTDKNYPNAKIGYEHLINTFIFLK